MYKKEAAAVVAILAGMWVDQTWNNKDFMFFIIAVPLFSWWLMTMLLTPENK